MSICFLRSKLMLSDLREHDGASSLSCPFSFGLQRTDKMGGGISISWMHRKRAFANNENGEGNLTILLWAEKHSFLLYLKKDIHRALFMAYAVALRIFFPYPPPSSAYKSLPQSVGGKMQLQELVFHKQSSCRAPLAWQAMAAWEGVRIRPCCLAKGELPCDCFSLKQST